MQYAVALEVQQMPWAQFCTLMVCEQMIEQGIAHCMQIGAIKACKKAKRCGV